MDCVYQFVRWVIHHLMTVVEKSNFLCSKTCWLHSVSGATPTSAASAWRRKSSTCSRRSRRPSVEPVLISSTCPRAASCAENWNSHVSLFALRTAFAARIFYLLKISDHNLVSIKFLKRDWTSFINWSPFFRFEILENQRNPVLKRKLYRVPAQSNQFMNHLETLLISKQHQFCYVKKQEKQLSAYGSTIFNCFFCYCRASPLPTRCHQFVLPLPLGRGVRVFRLLDFLRTSLRMLNIVHHSSCLLSWEANLNMEVEIH